MNNVYFSIEVRAGNGSDYKGNPLCNWINFKNAQNSFSLAECISHSRYVTISSINSLIPLTLCSVQVLTVKSKSTILCNENYYGDYLIFNDVCYKRYRKVSSIVIKMVISCPSLVIKQLVIQGVSPLSE